MIDTKMISCNRNCEKCRQLNIRTDDKGYPFGYDCLKYGDSVFREQFQSTKVFAIYDQGGLCNEWTQNSYRGAKMMDDIEAMCRIARAIVALKADPQIDIFKDEFKERYILEAGKELSWFVMRSSQKTMNKGCKSIKQKQ